MPISKSAYRRYKIIDLLIRNTSKPYPSIEEGMPNIFWDEINVRWLGLDPEFVKYEWNKDTLSWSLI
jgi:hypothetical protein